MSRLPGLDGPRGGQTYQPTKDRARLSKQADAVYGLMQDGRWRTLAAIAYHCAASEASVSARLRDLRKPRYGSHTVERRRRTQSVWEYRVEINTAA